MPIDDTVSRRDLLARGASATTLAAVGVVGCGPRAGPDAGAGPATDGTHGDDADGGGETAAPAGLPMRTLGGLGVSLPILGFGGAALAARFGHRGTTEEREQLVRHAFDQGVRYFDTAHRFSYGESQSLLGAALAPVRDEVFLTSKVDFWDTSSPDGTVTDLDPAAVGRQVEEILDDLGIEYIDALLIHGTPGLEQLTVEQALVVHAELVKARDRGLVRFLGFSAHHYFDKALALIETGSFDLCMLAVGYIPRGLSRIYTDETRAQRDACLAAAHAQGMGVVGMKVLGAGLMTGYGQPVVDAACRYVLQDERIDLLTIGMMDNEHVDANVAALSGDTTFTVEDEELLAEAAAQVYADPRVADMPRG